MTEIWLIRHGQSTANAGTQTTGIADAPLTDLGREQAREAARALPQAPAVIVASPYLRAQQTAEAARALYPDAAFETWETLREFAAISRAKYNGTTVDQRVPMMRAYWDRADPDYVDGEGAESFSAMRTRITASLARLAGMKGFIAVFTHERVMQAVRLFLAQPELDTGCLLRAFPGIAAQSRIPNGGVLRLVVDEGAVRLADDD